MEPSLKYHPYHAESLTVGVDPAGHCQAGSFTGVVTSQSVTEAHKGSLKLYRNQLLECKGKRELNCETDGSSRWETRS